MASKLKTLGLNLLRNAGFFRLARLINQGQTRILAYHRFGGRFITAQLFEEHIRYLKGYFNIIKLGSYIGFLCEQKELPPYSVIITIDDGYQDFCTVAFPIVKKYAIPVTVFLTTDFIDKQIWLWHDLVHFGINCTARTDFTINGRTFDLKKQDRKIALKLSVDQICTNLNTASRDEFIFQFLKELGVNVPEYPTTGYAPLTWNQIREMSKYGVSYGAHTCTHPVLSKIPPAEAMREIEESKHRIENVLQKEVVTFCYPNGKENDFNEDIKKMVKDCGFACAMSMIYGMNDRESDPYELRRMADRESFIHFVHDISGFGELRRSLRRIGMRYLRSGI